MIVMVPEAAQISINWSNHTAKFGVVVRSPGHGLITVEEADGVARFMAY